MDVIDLDKLLPEKLRTTVEDLVRSGEFASSADYIREVIRQDLRQRATHAELLRLLDDAERGPFTRLDEEGMASFRQRMERVIEEAAGNASTTD